MKTKFFFLVFSIILVFTSCQKEEVTDMVDAVGTTNSTNQASGLNTLQVANNSNLGNTAIYNSGSIGTTGLGNGTNSVQIPNIPELPYPNDCIATCNFAYYFIVDNGVEIGTCDAYTGPLNPIGYDWQVTTIYYDQVNNPANPWPTYSSNTNKVALPKCNNYYTVMAHSVTVTITFDNNTSKTEYFCYNDFQSLNICSGNEMGSMKLDGGCTGSVTASLILP